jgi:hypothetical protein
MQSTRREINRMFDVWRLAFRLRRQRDYNRMGRATRWRLRSRKSGVGVIAYAAATPDAERRSSGSDRMSRHSGRWPDLGRWSARGDRIGRKRWSPDAGWIIDRRRDLWRRSSRGNRMSWITRRWSSRCRSSADKNIRVGQLTDEHNWNSSHFVLKCFSLRVYWGFSREKPIHGKCGPIKLVWCCSQKSSSTNRLTSHSLLVYKS